MVKLPTLEEMLKAGVHFGHKISKWHPKMKDYIFCEKNGIHIIDLRITLKNLEKVLEHITDLVSNGGVVLFVGTKPHIKEFIKQKAIECKMPYINERWLGGLLTNFDVVSKLGKKLKRLKRQMESGEFNKYTKKEQLVFKREIDRLQNLVGGIENLDKIPDAIFVIDAKQSKTAVVEANKKGVEVIGICDTNINPERVDYIIPANDDSVQSLELFISLVSQAIVEAQQNKKSA